MRLNLFELIDDTLELLEENQQFYKNALMYVSSSFKMIFSEYKDSMITVNSRIKTPASLREKIIRNKYYRTCSSGQEILDGLSDLLGVMVECRFISDEERFWEVLKDRFTEEFENGFFSCPDFQGIYLNVESPQPQVQKNGFSIYRIDGFYMLNGEKVNFELQVKSLIHVFWSEIEHEIIYKNNNYMLMDGFMKRMLATIHNNLIGVDNQLSLIYGQVNFNNNMRNSVDENEFKMFFAKMINDLFCVKMLESMGFTVNFKKTCDILSQYIFMRANKVGNILDQSSLEKFTSRMRSMMKKSINFEEQIEMTEEFSPKDEFSDIVGNKLLELMNSDYEWNVFFKMLFEIEPLSNMGDFETFIGVIKDRLRNDDLYTQIVQSKKFLDVDIEEIKEDIAVEIARAFVNVESISIIYEKSLAFIGGRISTLCEFIADNLENIGEWRAQKDYILKMFRHKIEDYFED